MFKTIKNHKNKLFPFVDQGIVSGSNFAMGIILARVLGLESYGEYALSWLVILFCSSIHQAWIVSPLYTLYPKQPKEQKQAYFSAVCIHQLLFSILIAIGTWCTLTYFGSSLLGRSIENEIPWIVSCVFFYTLYDFVRRSFYVLAKLKRVIYLDTAVYGIQILGILLIGYSSTLSLTIVFQLLSIAYAIALLIGAPLFLFRQFLLAEVVKVGKEHWTFSKWLLATAMLQWMSGNFFLIAAASLLSPTAVGIIRILQNVIGLLHVLFLAIENYIPLKASKLFILGGHKALEQFLRTITWKGTLLTLALALGLAIFGEEILAFLYEGNYTDKAYLLYGFAGLYVLVFIGTTYRFAIRTLEKTSSIFIAYLWSGAFSLLFAQPIITTWGIEGVIVGLVGNQLIMQLYFIYSLKNQLNLLWK